MTKDSSHHLLLPLPDLLSSVTITEKCSAQVCMVSYLHRSDMKCSVITYHHPLQYGQIFPPSWEEQNISHSTVQCQNNGAFQPLTSHRSKSSSTLSGHCSFTTQSNPYIRIYKFKSLTKLEHTNVPSLVNSLYLY